ncbi:hypothetical protein TMEC54S_00106 [Thauera mechernichensis]|nr:abortive infection family protein [Accumulibacter sp.]
MDELSTDLERVQYLQNLLIAHATGSRSDDGDYQTVRRALLDNREVAEQLPGFVRTCRDLAQFWGFIKYEKGSYAERRELIWSSFAPLLDRLEGKASRPSDGPISEGLKNFDADGVHAVWAKALERRESDPEGAITSARTLLETVCKHVLDEAGVAYEKGRADLPDLYRLVAKELNLAPDQHTEDVFKQILGGVTSVVHGLGAMRNRLGDAHGKGKKPVRPAPRHAQLAVNLAGTVALFVIETWLAKPEAGNP